MKSKELKQKEARNRNIRQLDYWSKGPLTQTARTVEWQRSNMTLEDYFANKVNHHKRDINNLNCKLGYAQNDFDIH